MKRAETSAQLLPSAPWVGMLFALGVLILGMVPGALCFALDPTTASRIKLDSVPVPAWVFTAVWLVAYPCMGVATWLVWRTRDRQDVSIPIVLFVAAFLQTLSFWFTNSIRMTVLIDATGLVLACTVGWVYSRYWRAACWWLLPWTVWMAITLTIKLRAFSQGVP